MFQFEAKLKSAVMILAGAWLVTATIHGPRLVGPLFPGAPPSLLEAASAFVASTMWYVPQKWAEPANGITSLGFLVWLAWSAMLAVIVMAVASIFH